MVWRATSSLALPPKVYNRERPIYWHGTEASKRFEPSMDRTQSEVFEEYLKNPSSSPYRGSSHLSQSKGLLEVHYDRMRKSRQQRLEHQELNHPDKPVILRATPGYTGFVPAKKAENINGCSFACSNKISCDVRGENYEMLGGVTFNVGIRSKISSSSLSLSLPKSQSVPILPQIQIGSPNARSSPGGGGGGKGEPF